MKTYIYMKQLHVSFTELLYFRRYVSGQWPQILHLKKKKEMFEAVPKCEARLGICQAKSAADVLVKTISTYVPNISGHTFRINTYI